MCNKPLPLKLFQILKHCTGSFWLEKIWQAHFGLLQVCKLFFCFLIISIFWTIIYNYKEKKNGSIAEIWTRNWYIVRQTHIVNTKMLWVKPKSDKTIFIGKGFWPSLPKTGHSVDELKITPVRCFLPPHFHVWVGWTVEYFWCLEIFIHWICRKNTQ